jgi:hypothetical protein
MPTASTTPAAAIVGRTFEYIQPASVYSGAIRKYEQHAKVIINGSSVTNTSSAASACLNDSPRNGKCAIIIAAVLLKSTIVVAFIIEVVNTIRVDRSGCLNDGQRALGTSNTIAVIIEEPTDAVGNVDRRSSTSVRAPK